MRETSRCTVEYATGRFCDTPSIHWAPFPICGRHAIDLFMTVDAHLAAGQRDELLVLMTAFEEIDEIRARAANRQSRRVPQPEQNPVIYFLLIDGLIKIGYASNLTNRLRSYPPHAQLLATEPGERMREAELHSRFNEYLAAGREWFTPGPKLRDYIEGLADYRAA